MKEKLMKKVLSCAAAMVMCLNLGTAVVSAEAYTDAAAIEAKLAELSVDLTTYNKLASKDVVLSELTGVDFTNDEDLVVAFEAAMDKYVVEETIYPSKIVKMQQNTATDASESNFNLQWDTVGIISYSIENISDIIDMEISTAALDGTSLGLKIGINSVSFDVPPSGYDYAAWDSFVPKNTTDVMQIMPTLVHKQYVTSNGFYEAVVDPAEFTGNITMRIRNAGDKVLQLFKDYPTCLVVKRDCTMVYDSLLDEINGAKDAMTIETILGVYLNSSDFNITELDSKRYSMMNNTTVFAEEFVSKQFESFSEFKSVFDAALEKYVSATVISPEWYALHAANQVDTRKGVISQFSIKNNNNQGALFGYDFSNVSKDTLRSLVLKIRNKEANSLSNTDVNVAYEAVPEYPMTIDFSTSGGYSTTGQDYHTKIYTNVINRLTPVNVFTLPNEADAYFTGALAYNVMSDLISANNQKLMIRLSRNVNEQVTIYPDVEIIAYNDLTGIYAELGEILSGDADKNKIKSWVEANGASIGIDKNALYNLDGVYAALAGNAYADTEALANAFNEEVEKFMIDRFIEVENEISRADGGQIFRFYKNSLPVANGNGWNNLILSFPLAANAYIKDIAYVNTLGWTVSANKKFNVISYTTQSIPALPVAEPSKNGTDLNNTDTTGIYSAWKDYYSKFTNLSGISYVFNEEGAVGAEAVVDLGDDVLNAVQADVSQLNITVSSDTNLQLNSVYDTSGTKIPARLKITYDSTAITAMLTDAVNNAESSSEVLEAISEFGFVLPEYEWFNTLSDEAKLSAAATVFENKDYNDDKEISAVLNLVKLDDGNTFIITDVKVNESGKATSASVTKLNAYSGSVVICSVYYNNNQMVYVGVAEPGQEPATVGDSSDVTLKAEYSGDFDEVKVFVLESLTTIKPLAKSFVK